MKSKEWQNRIIAWCLVICMLMTSAITSPTAVWADTDNAESTDNGGNTDSIENTDDLGDSTNTEKPEDIAYWSGGIAATFSGGDGTEDNPYLIGSGEELSLLRVYVNNGNQDYNSAYYKLTKDIWLNDCDDWKNWGGVRKRI